MPARFHVSPSKASLPRLQKDYSPRRRQALGERDSHDYSPSMLTSFVYWLACTRVQLNKADALLRMRQGKNPDLRARRSEVRREKRGVP